MNSVVILLGIVALANAGPLQIQQKIDPKLNWRIVGGSNAAAGQFPFQVSLRFTGSHMCGGSIIGPKKILTAAHCVERASPELLSVGVGSNKLEPSGTLYSVKAISVHPDWNPGTVSNDIAVLTLTNNIAGAPTIQYINLETNFIGGGKPCVLSGWGLTSYPGFIPNDLQYINLSTITLENCTQRLPAYRITSAQVCTLTRTRQGACQGDSGGPLTADGKQIGIVSWGIPCAVGYPDVYTRVSFYIDWIAQQ